MRPLLPALVLALALAAPAAAEPPPDLIKLPSAGGKAKSFADAAEVTATVEPAQAKPGQTVTLKVTVAPKPGFATYPTSVPAHQAGRNVILLPPPGDLIFVEPVSDPPGWKEKRSDLDPTKKDRVYPSPMTPTWQFTAVVSPKATPGPKTVALKVGTKFQSCIEGTGGACFYSDQFNPPSATVEVLPGPPVPVDPKYAAKVNGRAPPPPLPANPPRIGRDPGAPLPGQSRAGGGDAAKPASLEQPAEEKRTGIVQKAPVSVEQHKAGLDALEGRIDKTPVVVQGGLLGLLAAAAFWGLVSLATPCVFPMIPITVSLFLKQGHQHAGQAVKLALVYCLTIIIVLGASAVFLLSIFRALSVDPYMNVFLGGLFIFFALSLFGMYDITLPGFLLRATERRRGAGGMIGTVFGALAFSIVSFTCVAPFLGGFAGMAGSQQYSKLELVLAGVVFAAAFASPFFVLALFPSLLKRLPKSGGWLDSVKVVMGFLELAAAFKFFRTAELRLSVRPEYFTYDLVLGVWVAIAVAAGLYLLNLYRLPHDEEKPNVGVARMLFGVAFITLGVYLVPALFRGGPSGQPNRPGGAIYAWVDAFLLPEPAEAGGEDLPWGTDLKGAVDRIVRDKQRSGNAAKPLILVDFTGVTCTNCRLNEKNVFPQPRVRELMAQYTLVQMYTDEVPAAFYTAAPPDQDRNLEAAYNLKFQREMFGTEQLPLYVVLEPQVSGRVRVVGVYDEGKINDVGRFVEFLKKPLEAK